MQSCARSYWLPLAAAVFWLPQSALALTVAPVSVESRGVDAVDDDRGSGARGEDANSDPEHDRRPEQPGARQVEVESARELVLARPYEYEQRAEEREASGCEREEGEPG